jgi:eukaryotic-like serine/threonine-protein kinase
MDEQTRREWAEADAALDRLLDLEPGERIVALARMELSASVRARVERLLAADAASVTPLDRPISMAASSALEGQVIARWRLGPEIGRGGMSVVHAAEALDLPGQRAAVKLLTVGAIAAQGLERFHREQAILARLSHPHIAALHDAGITADGTPWLAMALVDGQRIDVWCRDRALDVASRVRLLLDVCDAVAYAHQALVIHRDLKPGNVLVDAAGHVRLLDFGIARLGDESDGERTETAHRALTPEYAAPEQFSGAPPSTAMDVWGIGALAYQLLTGRPPRASAAVAGSLTRPSRAVADGHFGDLTTTQRARRMQRGDLDAIVLKALSPEPGRRYASVALLAEDLRRWLDGQPVLAQPPTLRYRAGRFVRRHRGAVASAVLTVLAILAGLVLALWQADRAAKAAAEARIQAARAEAQLRRADSLREFLMRLFDASDRERVADALPSVADLLERGAERARDARDLDPVVQADMLATIGRLYLFVGRGEQAVSLLELAIEKAREAGREGDFERARALTWRALAAPSGGSTGPDESGIEEADRLLSKIAPAHPLRVEVRRNWSWMRLNAFDFEGALALIEPVIDGSWDGPSPSQAERLLLLARVALLEARLGRLDAAKRGHDAVIAGYRQRGEEGTRNFAVELVNASGTDLRVGAFDEAIARTREAIAIHDRLGEAPTPFRASAWLRLGQVFETLGQFDEALNAYEHSNQQWAAMRQIPIEDYSFTWLARGQLAAAALDQAATVEALQRFDELAAAAGIDVRGYRALVAAELAGARCELGDVDAATGIAPARAALQEGAHERERSAFTIELAEARCALARGELVETFAALDAAAAVLPPARGTEALDTRAALVRVMALRRDGDAEAARQLAKQAIQRLDEAGLAEHPYRARLDDQGVDLRP